MREKITDRNRVKAAQERNGLVAALGLDGREEIE